MNLPLSNRMKICFVMILASACVIVTGVFVTTQQAAIQVQERRQGQLETVTIREAAFEDIPITYKLDEVKAHYLAVVRLQRWQGAELVQDPMVSVYNQPNNRILTYRKIKVQILLEPTIPCELCQDGPYPESLNPVAADELILLHSGGTAIANGKIFRQTYRGISGISMNAQANGPDHKQSSVLLLNRDKNNPTLVTIGCDRSCIYPITYDGDVPKIKVNSADNYVMEAKYGLHPLMSLNPVPNDPKTSDELNMPVSQLQTILNQ
jgi:hypothetical protein